MGAHFDVVTADSESWAHDPFELVVDGDTLLGRGTTDCLGHVALLTELVRAMGDARERPRRTLTIILIANEESSPVTGLGMEHVVASGHLDRIRGTPLVWLDGADFGPTVGTGGAARWRLDVQGVSGHSGIAYQCVNAIDLAMAVVPWLQRRFAEVAPAHPAEETYGFLGPSTFKPTWIEAPNLGPATIPGRARVEGDIRLTPFYDLAEVQRGLADAAHELLTSIGDNRAPAGFPPVRTRDGRGAGMTFEWLSGSMEGLACDLESPVLRLLERAIQRARPGATRIGMTGALPLVRELRQAGFDVQITGFGLGTSYHAPNEQARLSDFAAGFAVLLELVREY